MNDQMRKVQQMLKTAKITGEFLLIVVFALIAMSAESQTINGAGASFPYPVYSQWAYKYNRLTGTKINYQSIGSGGGIAQIKAKTVDFGASDAPLKKKELDREGLIQFPMVMGGVTPVVNIKGVNPLTGKDLKDFKIFLSVYAEKIVEKWVNYFIYHMHVEFERISKKIK